MAPSIQHNAYKCDATRCASVGGAEHCGARRGGCWAVPPRLLLWRRLAGQGVCPMARTFRAPQAGAHSPGTGLRSGFARRVCETRRRTPRRKLSRTLSRTAPGTPGGSSRPIVPTRRRKPQAAPPPTAPTAAGTAPWVNFIPDEIRARQARRASSGFTALWHRCTWAHTSWSTSGW